MFENIIIRILSFEFVTTSGVCVAMFQLAPTHHTMSDVACKPCATVTEQLAVSDDLSSTAVNNATNNSTCTTASSADADHVTKTSQQDDSKHDDKV